MFPLFNLFLSSNLYSYFRIEFYFSWDRFKWLKWLFPTCSPGIQRRKSICWASPISKSFTWCAPQPKAETATARRIKERKKKKKEKKKWKEQKTRVVTKSNSWLRVGSVLLILKSSIQGLEFNLVKLFPAETWKDSCLFPPPFFFSILWL